MNIVLDTCALIWWSLDPDKLSPKAKVACERMEQLKNGIVPSIAIWEIALKVKNSKLNLGVSLDDYSRPKWVVNTIKGLSPQPPLERGA